MPARNTTATLSLAHTALLECTLINKNREPDLFRLVGYHLSAIQAWHADHSGWRVRRVADTLSP